MFNPRPLPLRCRKVRFIRDAQVWASLVRSTLKSAGRSAAMQKAPRLLNRGVRRAVTRRTVRTDTAPPQQAQFEQGGESTNLTERSGSGRGAETYHLGFSRAGRILNIFRETSPRNKRGFGGAANENTNASAVFSLSKPPMSFGSFGTRQRNPPGGGTSPSRPQAETDSHVGAYASSE